MAGVASWKRAGSSLARLALALALAAPAARAGHDADLHSDSMALLANWNHHGAYRQGSDLAFWGDLAVLGSYDSPGGFRLLDVSAPTRPTLVGQLECPGPQGDVSIWGDFVFLSVDSPRSGPECGAAAASQGQVLSGEAWEGIRIVSLENPAKPVQIATVATDCGSHTHTLVPDLRHSDAKGRAAPRVLLYVLSYPLGGQGATCNAESHRKISVVEVPLAAPRRARVVSTPAVSPAIGCHDVTVFLPRRLAAAACITESQIWDISDPVRPQILAHVYNPAANIHHSTTFSWDGRTLVIGDELGGAAAAPGCLTAGHAPLGALWFLDVSDPRDPTLAGWFQVPQAEPSAFCTAHNFNAVPLPGARDILVSAWYNGGTIVVDFTDPSEPTQLGFYISREGGQSAAWSSYWYNGFVYVNNFDEDVNSLTKKSRGFDVLRVAHPALRHALRLPRLNPQTMEQVPRTGR